ncbi:MAG TPA: dockerin type I domain-containing protein, partial [Planctomycetota bacterium]|nr:dockerin type I domain-containing protein [Planctomycetota bacterium]
MNRSPRLLLLLMAVALPLSAPAVRADVWPIPGDANLDCKVDILDLLLIRSKLGLQPADADNWKADATQDGRINILDLIAVRNSLN